MSDDLEMALQTIDGEGPSPEFVAGLREQLAAELASSADFGEHEPVVAIDPRPEQEEPVMTKARLILAGLAAAAIALVVGFAALRSEERGLETIATPDESTTTTDPTTTVPTTQAAATFAADATPLPRGFATIQTGSHRADDFSTPFAFAIEQSMFVQEYLRTRVAVSNVASRDPGDKDIVFMPLAVDYDRWLEILADGRLDVDSEETMLGEFRASRVDVDESSCSEDAFCREFGTSEAGLSSVFTSGSRYRIWVIEHDNEAPLAAIAGIRDESEIVWFDVADQVVSSLEFGPAETE